MLANSSMSDSSKRHAKPFARRRAVTVGGILVMILLAYRLFYVKGLPDHPVMHDDAWQMCRSNSALRPDALRTAVATVITIDDPMYVTQLGLLAQDLARAMAMWDDTAGPPFELLCVGYADTVSKQTQEKLTRWGYRMVLVPSELRWTPAYMDWCHANNGIPRVYHDQFIKVHLWRLIQFDRILYMDADHRVFPKTPTAPISRSDPAAPTPAQMLAWLFRVPLSGADIVGCPVRDNYLWSEEARVILNGAFFLLRPDLTTYATLTAADTGVDRASPRDGPPRPRDMFDHIPRPWWRRLPLTGYRYEQDQRDTKLYCTEMGILNDVFRGVRMKNAHAWHLPPCFSDSVCFNLLWFVKDEAYRSRFMPNSTSTDVATVLAQNKVWFVHGFKGNNDHWYNDRRFWDGPIGEATYRAVWVPFIRDFMDLYHSG